MGERQLINRGAIVLVNLPKTETHEQSGVGRPCVVVSSEISISNARHDMVVVVPLTTTKLRGQLFPKILSNEGNLKSDSFALIEQIRSIDRARIKGLIGNLSSSSMALIDDSIKYLLGYDS